MRLVSFLIYSNGIYYCHNVEIFFKDILKYTKWIEQLEFISVLVDSDWIDSQKKMD